MLTTILNVIPVLIVLLIMVYAGLLAYQKNWAALRELAYQSMLKAEKVFGANNGKQKFKAVLDAVYLQLPWWAQLLMPTKKELEPRLQEWYDAAKDWLDDGVLNGSDDITEG